jgi:hypothetical protein
VRKAGVRSRRTTMEGVVAIEKTALAVDAFFVIKKDEKN